MTRPRSLGELAARRQALVERAAWQRRAIGDAVAGLAPALALGDRVADAGRLLRSHPLLLAAAGGLLLARWPRATLSAAKWALAAWGAARRVLPSHA